MQGDLKIVHYWEYCHKCKHKNVKPNEDPCYECLNNPAKVDSHKPIDFEE